MSVRRAHIIPQLIARLVIVILVLLVGAGAMRFLLSLREEPQQLSPPEPRLAVEVVTPEEEDAEVVIAGFGQARSLDVVSLSAEVMGQVIAVHPRLEPGEVIPKGEMLFRIDPRDYASAVDQARAQLAQMTDMAARLRRQYAIDRDRLVTLARSRDLSRQEYLRVQQLFEDDEVGTLSGVERAEMAYNQSNDAHDQLSQAVELYPLRIREAEAGIASAQAQLALAETQLTRTEAVAPFTGRLKEVQLEEGQFVSPGAALLTLANDAVLEIHVPLDSRDAQRWLLFTGEQPEGASWFARPEPVICRVRWSEDPEDHVWEGTLDRVVSFDENTRTVTVAVRVTESQARPSGVKQLPLLDGMFCRVEIPGRTLRGVFRLPRWAVNFENVTYLAREGVDIMAIEAPLGSPLRADVQRTLTAAREAALISRDDTGDPLPPGEQGLDVGQRRLWEEFQKAAQNYVRAGEASGGRAGLIRWVPREELEAGLAAEAFAPGVHGETDIIENAQGFYLMRPRHRLEAREVEVLRSQGEEALVRGGLRAGDAVIITRLDSPLPGALLDVRATPAGDERS